MAKKTENTTENLNTDQALNNAEDFFTKNKKAITTSSTVVLGIVTLYMGYNSFIAEPKMQEVQEKIWPAELNLKNDSLTTALNGNNESYGLTYIFDEYGSTPAGQRAGYEAGIAAMNKGDFQLAISILEEVNVNNTLVNAMAKMALGDAYLETQNANGAIDNYKKASTSGENDYVTPMALKKLGLTYETVDDFNGAAEAYKSIEKNYPNSKEGRDISKYIARAEAKI